MDDTQLYPNDGSYFTPSIPDDQKKEIREEKAQVETLRPLLLESINRLKERVAFYSTIEAIDDEIVLDPTKLSIVVAANKLTAENLQNELNTLEGLYNEYAE